MSECEAILECKAKHKIQKLFLNMYSRLPSSLGFISPPAFIIINGYFLFPLNSFNPDINIICA